MDEALIALAARYEVAEANFVRLLRGADVVARVSRITAWPNFLGIIVAKRVKGDFPLVFDNSTGERKCREA